MNDRQDHGAGILHGSRHTAITVCATELDLGTASSFDAQLQEVSLEQVRELTLDMRRVVFIDCIGLRAIERADTRLRKHGISLTVRSLRRQPRRLISLTGLTVPIEP